MLRLLPSLSDHSWETVINEVSGKTRLTRGYRLDGKEKETIVDGAARAKRWRD
jgi:hypothetical protein